MSGKYLLDTNIIIALFADEAVVKSNLARANEVFISSIAIGELYYGARRSSRSNENLARIDELVANTTVLGCNTQTARYYGEVKNKLRLKGRPLPENDIWIAALALQHSLTLVTRDAHFQQVENLQIVVW
ncbi:MULTISPECIES: type II toxin-antitoxin system VapC family toxin [Chroococcidiopsis]|uniref:Ribonuclease VapC n=1 Tax=Chroococcidiopsis thermalis (strain PCC 7203) TaxID=251229 RepID=K9U0N6_CHRTP|nr:MULTISPECIES: type II toxin-antitoxin system VapC family toxin [Chroococcidiopsis]AFY87769.1 PilT protein domain protein [Chroococcidiopsis thermalis PCC 7203]PSB46746.1 type II toxin-antitoxin system VapC family toxin [Cyanosarcina cf. burmensis CCALA 770]URD52683.1 type II toxin-antitoxin system VapC family toxin [Chroococcidiopsis sp. CCNUC1]